MNQFTANSTSGNQSLDGGATCGDLETGGRHGGWSTWGLSAFKKVMNLRVYMIYLLTFSVHR